MKSEEEIKKHIEYLSDAVDKDDPTQLRELNIRLSELSWVLE